MDMLLEEMKLAGIEARVSEGRLLVRGIGQDTPSDLVQRIRDHKVELVTRLIASGDEPDVCGTSPLFDGLDERETSRALANKATVPGGKSPAQELEELQEWLATIDWSIGLRCGLSRQQCKACRGIPCRGSTAWAGQAE